MNSYVKMGHKLYRTVKCPFCGREYIAETINHHIKEEHGQREMRP